MIRKLLMLLSRPPARLCRGKGAQRAQVGGGDEAGKEGRSGGRLNSRTYLIVRFTRGPVTVILCRGNCLLPTDEDELVSDPKNILHGFCGNRISRTSTGIEIRLIVTALQPSKYFNSDGIHSGKVFVTNVQQGKQKKYYNQVSPSH